MTPHSIEARYKRMRIRGASIRRARQRLGLIRAEAVALEKRNAGLFIAFHYTRMVPVLTAAARELRWAFSAAWRSDQALYSGKEYSAEQREVVDKAIKETHARRKLALRRWRKISQRCSRRFRSMPRRYGMQVFSFKSVLRLYELAARYAAVYDRMRWDILFRHEVAEQNWMRSMLRTLPCKDRMFFLDLEIFKVPPLDAVREEFVK